MEENKKIARFNYEANLHHKQVLRSQIDPKLLQQIQISQNPSKNYRNAYQTLYHQQLEKSVQEQQSKKNRQRIQKQYIKSLHNGTLKQEDNYPQIGYQDQNLNKSNFIDYYQQRDKKFQDLINKNFDGGQSFYQSHDNYLKNKIKQSLSVNNILKNQIEWKQYNRYMLKQNKNLQNQSFQLFKYYQKQQQKVLNRQKYQQKQQFRNQIKKQIQQEKIKKQRKSRFQYCNISRHNPITNPIEYHIDNPYILKKIQANKIINNQSSDYQ